MGPYLIVVIELFAIIDPVGNLLIFEALTGHMARSQRVAVALLATFSAFIILLLFLLVGTPLLRYLGISLDAFQVAAGILLLIPALRLIDKGTPMEVGAVAGASPSSVAVVPLGVPLLAGPGAIASAILFRDSIGGLTTLAAAATILIFTAIMFCLASVLALARHRLIVETLAKMVGILLAVLAVQFILSGAAAVFR